NQIDATTGTSRLKAVFPNKNFTLFPSQFVNIRLLVDTLRNQVVIPTVAIQRGQEGTYVYTVANGVAHLQLVQPGITEGTNTSIRSGLNGGEQVVIDGFDRLADKAKVRLRPPTGSATLTPTGVSNPSEEDEGPAPGASGGKRAHGKGAGAPPAGAGTRSSRKGAEGKTQ